MQSLDLSKNGIRKIEGLETLFTLHTLDLSDNDIAAVENLVLCVSSLRAT